MTKITRFKEYALVESMIDDLVHRFESLDNDTKVSQIEEILARYKDKFGNKKPTNQQFADFYHQLRTGGYESDLIFDTLEGVLPPEEEDLPFSEAGSSFKRIEKKVLSDLKLDTKLVFTFGAGIGALYPIIQKMMENLSLSSIEMTRESTVLLTIACITIVFLEEKKSSSSEEADKLTKDSKSMLEELRMRGIGDGLVKKVIKSIQSLKNVFSVIAKHTGAMIGGIIDMLGYTAILIPIMNSILWIIGKYEMSVDTVSQNFFSIGVGIASRIAKHGLVELIGKLKGLISDKTKGEIIDELETPIIQRFSDIRDQEDEQAGELIKEQ